MAMPLTRRAMAGSRSWRAFKYIAANLPVLILLLSSAVDTQASEDTLDLLISRALDNQAELRAARYTTEAAEFSQRSASALPDPMFTVGWMNLPRNSLALDETPMSGINLGLSQKIPWPGELSAKSDLARLQTERLETQELSVRDQIVREVTDAYLDYSYWQAAEDIVEDNRQLVIAILEVAETRYGTGEASAQDVLRAQSMAARLEVRLLKAVEQQQAAMARLYRAVGDSSLLVDLPTYLPEPNRDAPLPADVKGNPHLNSLRLGVDEAQARYNLSRSAYWPDFTLGVDYRIRQDMPGDPVRGEDFLSFKVGVNLPLWFFKKQKPEVAASRRMEQAAAERVRAVRDDLRRQFTETQARLGQISSSLQRYDKKVVPPTEAALEAAEVAYEVGTIDFDALLTAQTDVLDVQLERLDLVRRFHQTRAKLDMLAGTFEER
ncbi:hypothetical protein GF377_01700 [candidate division GN15 bacterium]|nr:hypothetical protein [candidate division GN15 bacterium]